MHQAIADRSSLSATLSGFPQKRGVDKERLGRTLVIFRLGELTWYNRRGTRVCRNIFSKPVDKKSFRLVDVCRTSTGHAEQESYTLKRLNSLQVFITPDGTGSRTYELIGCPT